MSDRFGYAVIALYLVLVFLTGGRLVAGLFADPVGASAPGAAVSSAAPASAPGTQAPEPRYRLKLWKLERQLNQDQRLLFLALAMGALGSCVHAATSLADFVGNRRFRLHWGLWYLLRPWIGAALALVLYFVLRGGLLTAVDGKSVNPFGIAAVCGMTGMFSKQATDKLEEVFTTLLRTGKDAKRADKLDPGLVILEVLPPLLEMGKANQKVEILGHGFEPGVRVDFGGKLVTPVEVQADRLQLALDADVLAVAGPLAVIAVAATGAKSAPFQVHVMA